MRGGENKAKETGTKQQKPSCFKGTLEANTIRSMFAHMQKSAVVLNEQSKYLNPTDISDGKVGLNRDENEPHPAQQQCYENLCERVLEINRRVYIYIHALGFKNLLS